MTEYDRFRAARDLLIAHRTDYAAARAAFRWPTLTTFNWAIDWFDEIARSNEALALHIVEKTYVVLNAGHASDAATAQSIFAFLRDTVSPYKMIRRIEFSDLPKTTSGKIRRTELRTSEAARPATGPRNDREFLEERSR